MTIILLISLLFKSTTAFLHPTTPSRRPFYSSLIEEWDVIVVGSGIGGLSAASLCARHGLSTICLEAHEIPGGCAHSFQRRSRDPIRPFRFDSGPSLLSGLSTSGSTNPLRQLLDAVGVAERVEWVQYDGWMVHDTAFPTDDSRSSFKMTTGSSGIFERSIETKAGIRSRQQFDTFKHRMLARDGLSESSAKIPPMALRGDIGAVLTLASYWNDLLAIGLKGFGGLLTGPFSDCMDTFGMTDEFGRKWFDYLAFALSGLDAAHTQAAPVAYTMMDLHGDGAVLDYPKGGMDSLVQALVKGLEMNRGTTSRGELRLNSRVRRFLLEDDNNRPTCNGVVLDNGTILKARRGVICNVPLWNTAKLLEDSIVDPLDFNVAAAVNDVRKRANDMEMTGSFMHLHLGIPSDGLPDDLECHHSVLNFNQSVTAEQNLVIISIPTVFDPTLAPEGYHIIHAYTAASENFVDWENELNGGVDAGITEPNDYRRSPSYRDLKEKKAEALWLALERIIPDVRERAGRQGSVVEAGTPLTHRRYNRRFRGAYGPAPPVGKVVWDLPGPSTPFRGLLMCGDTTFPGIGVPGVAASGTIAANTLVGVDVQLRLLGEMREAGLLQ